MTMREFLPTPLGQAVKSTIVIALFGVGVYFIWGAFDPEMRKWTLVIISPLMGGITYLMASQRAAALTAVFLLLGTGGLIFWLTILWSGAMPVTTRVEWFYVAVILAFPLACLGLGARMLWRLRTIRAADVQNSRA